MPFLGQCLHLSCIFEATARKPGNVQRFRDFADLSYTDFLLSAAASAPVLESASQIGVGPAVLAAIQETRRFVRTNSNLGIVLLLAPLAAASRHSDLKSGIAEVLARLTVTDSRDAFAAIRLANPGGLGSAPEQDVHNEPTLPLCEVMALAADRDLIARQYANGFLDVFEIGVPELVDLTRQTGELETAIIGAHLRLIAEVGDSHVARRAGAAEERVVQQRARELLAASWPQSESSRTALVEYDRWLREPGTRRNPGSTADLVAACLFVALYGRRIELPIQFASTAEPLP